MAEKNNSDQRNKISCLQIANEKSLLKFFYTFLEGFPFIAENMQSKERFGQFTTYSVVGCLKLNDKKLFQNGSLGAKISLLTSLFKCSFLDNSCCEL